MADGARRTYADQTRTGGEVRCNVPEIQLAAA